MILALVLVSGDLVERVLLYLPATLRPLAAALLRGTPPAALGRRFDHDG
jgi:hypothetical protein